MTAACIATNPSGRPSRIDRAKVTSGRRTAEIVSEMTDSRSRAPYRRISAWSTGRSVARAFPTSDPWGVSHGPNDHGQEGYSALADARHYESTKGTGTRCV